VLVNKERISIWINGHETAGTGRGLVRLVGQWDPGRFQLALEVSDVGE
jgi:hypothetical protein